MAILRRWRILLLITTLSIGLALLVGFFYRDWLVEHWWGERDRFPPGALADYVPEDSEAVLAIDVRSLVQSPVGQHLGLPLHQLLRQGPQRLRWMDLLGVQPLDDLESLLLSFAPGSGQEPLWLVRGRLDRSHVQTGPDKLEEKTVDHFLTWEYRDRPSKGVTLIAPVGDMFVASETPGRVLAALKQASDPQPRPVRDATLRELLTKVDRRQTVWLAASVKRLGSIRGIENFWLRTVLNPLLAHAESVYGEIACTEEVRAVLHFRAASATDADKLEAALKSICDLARDGAWLVGRQKELLPLLRLLGSGQIQREGRTIVLECRLSADQL